RIIMQVHYSPHFGKVLPDRTEIGLYLAKGEVTKELQYGVIDNDEFVIPAGAEDHVVEASTTVGADIEIYQIYPHMHLIGRRMTVEAILPDGTKQCMIQIPDYDFKWQGAYLYRTPLTIAKNSRLHIEAHYDNSANNFRNPSSPPKPVHFGEASTDEMCVALVGYVVKSQ
ncbi:MAG TPA: peroxiredoxin, partial [Thermoanaerobaculia bacterium]|nr:peroxiredoxin [Thermoanaerobaculia bacterium]